MGCPNHKPFDLHKITSKTPFSSMQFFCVENIDNNSRNKKIAPTIQMDSTNNSLSILDTGKSTSKVVVH